MIRIGQEFELEYQFSQQQVDLFAEVTGDNNPIHSNAEYAALTPFKRPILHGFLSASVFSRIFGTLFPGDGTVYMSQSMKFLKPMYVDQPYKAMVRVAEAFPEKHRAKFSTEVFDAGGEMTISGEALIYHKTLL